METVSIIVPIYNAERYVEQCIVSILNQSYKHVEVILVNDGSKDSSGEICKKYCKDERVKYIEQINEGVSAARNAGLEASKGEYLLFVDADDELELDMVEFLIDKIKKHHADISICLAKIVDGNGNSEPATYTNNILTLSSIDAIKMLLLGDLRIREAAWNKLFKRTVIKEGFLVGKRMNEDKYFCFKAFANARTIVLAESPKYKYYQRVNSVTKAGFSDSYFDEDQIDSQIYLDVVKHDPELERVARTAKLLCKYKILEKMISSKKRKEYLSQYNRLIEDVNNIQYNDCKEYISKKRQIGLMLIKTCPSVFCKAVEWYAK